MNARQQWKAWYRQFRIIRRETLKAATDMMLFGMGYIMITPEPDHIHHVPIEQVVIEW